MSGIARRSHGGRPAISDFAALELMAKLERIYAEGGVPRGARALAREIVERVNVVGASEEAAADRLRRKYRELHQEGAEFSPIKSQAPTPELRHVSSDEAEMVGMYVGLEREPDGTTAAAVQVVTAHEAPRTNRASARVVERPRVSRSRGGPRYVVSIRVNLTGSESVELRLKSGAAKELFDELRVALAEIDRLRSACASNEEADTDVR